MFLAAYKVGVNARLGDKLFMLALLDYASVIDNKYPVGVTHRFQPARDHDYRLVARQRFDSLLQSVLVLGVDVCRSLIENDHGRVLKHGTRNGNALALAAGKPLAGFTCRSVVALRQL